jgi:hypothetical protein
MQVMKRLSIAFAALIGACFLAPAGASATAVEIGSTTTPLVAPSCPTGVSQTQCDIVLTQVTAFESIRDGVQFPTLVKQAGEVVAFTLGISQLSSTKKVAATDIAYLNSKYGAPAEAELTVLRPIGPRATFGWQVAAQSGPVQLLPYLGSVSEFPLLQPVPVVPGELIGITVPTWAPVLSIDVTSSKFAYRQDRSSSCPTSPAGMAQLVIGLQAMYKCAYPGTRIEYTATEITAPAPTTATNSSHVSSARRAADHRR